MTHDMHDIQGLLWGATISDYRIAIVFLAFIYSSLNDRRVILHLSSQRIMSVYAHVSEESTMGPRRHKSESTMGPRRRRHKDCGQSLDRDTSYPNTPHAC
jgi:hypothetical protein